MERLKLNGLAAITAAAERGAPDALFELGLCYANGQGVPQDYVEAHKWFNIAAMRGNIEARRYRQEISSEMSKAQIGVAQKRAREWLAKR